MSRGPLRVGLVGFGLGGAVFHAPLVEAEPDLELAAIVTSDAERSAAAMARFPGARVVPTVDALFDAADELDLVVVATPNRFHVPIAVEACSRGLHVVIDKPMAPSAEEARRAVAAAAGAGVMLSVFQNRRFDGDYLTVSRLIADGELGRVTRFESRFERWVPEVPPGAWRELGDPAEGGGLLLDLGAHLVDQAVRLFGPPATVYGEVERRRAGARTDDDAFVALRHRDGVVSHLWMSAVAGAPGPRFRVLGLGGAYEKHGLDLQEAQLSAGVRPDDPAYGVESDDRWGVLARGQDRTPVPTERGDYPRYYAGIAAAIRSGGDPPVGSGDAVATLEVLEAARRSAATGEAVAP